MFQKVKRIFGYCYDLVNVINLTLLQSDHIKQLPLGHCLCYFLKITSCLLFWNYNKTNFLFFFNWSTWSACKFVIKVSNEIIKNLGKGGKDQKILLYFNQYRRAFTSTLTSIQLKYFQSFNYSFHEHFF
jgi:hypothetical protein